jgi:hypothetical protein
MCVSFSFYLILKTANNSSSRKIDVNGNVNILNFFNSAWMAVAFSMYFLPDKGGLILIERDGIEIVEGSMQNLIAAIEVQSESA